MNKNLSYSIIETKLGNMLAIATDKNLFFLKFIEVTNLEKEKANFEKKFKINIFENENDPIKSIKTELDLYFQNKLKKFKTSISLIGTDFQKKVWQSLMNIPFGQTKSYSQIAKEINNSKAFQAIGQANGSNPIAIIIPCHRVINLNGQIGGYNGGLERKKYLLNHEKTIK